MATMYCASALRRSSRPSSAVRKWRISDHGLDAVLGYFQVGRVVEHPTVFEERDDAACSRALRFARAPRDAATNDREADVGQASGDLTRSHAWRQCGIVSGA